MAATLASLTLSASSAHAADCTGASLLPALASVPTAKAATLCLLNHERSARGLLPLAAEPALEGAAGSYAQAMVQERFFGHVTPGGEGIVERLASYVGSDPSAATAENLSVGSNGLATPSSVVRRWMASDMHRGNILSERFADIGVGIAAGTPSGGLPAISATYVAAFGSRSGAASADAAPIRGSAASIRPSAASAAPIQPSAASAASAASEAARTTKKRVSAKQRKQISRRCHRIARRTKGSKKMRTARYDRCVRKELRAATR